jgi:hypothetical protein
MPDESPPKLEGCPGHVFRKRKVGWTVIWQARTDLIRRGYKPKSIKLAIVTAEVSDLERKFISDYCKSLQNSMLAWANGGVPTVGPYNGTLDSLVHCYMTDEQSRYQKLRYRSKENYRTFLNLIAREHGHELVADIKGRQAIGWHEHWSKNRGVSMAHQLMGMLRTILTFGATILDDADCRAAKVLLADMRFEMGKPRTTILTYEQAEAVRRVAHDKGWHSVAFAQALQFDLTLRQKDVVGEWVPQSEPGISDVLYGYNKWLRGLRWEEIGDNLVLDHITSKRLKVVEPNLRLAPMVMEELQRLGFNGDRSSLPQSGPIIIPEGKNVPYFNNAFRRKWRACANATGLPKKVYNMDSRAGAITEALMAGARLQSVRKMATHSTESMTQRYSRGDAEEIAEVMKLRAAHRNKSGT